MMLSFTSTPFTIFSGDFLDQFSTDEDRILYGVQTTDFELFVFSFHVDFL